MSETKQKIIAVLALVILLLTMVYYTGDLRSRYTPVEDLTLAVISPVQGFFSRLGHSVLGPFRGFFEYRELLKENERLKRELAVRNNVRYQLLELQKENYRLREMLGFKERTEYTLLPAEVIARDPSYWFETITINKGYADGVQKDMAVVTSEGLVGSISYVSRNSARVLLLTDSRRAVSALVQRSRDPGSVGIVEGYPEKKGYLRIINLPPESNIQPGDTLISSGLGGVFPKGLVIGHIIEIDVDQYGLLQQALVNPAVNFNRLEEVFIVTGVPQEVEDDEESGNGTEPEEIEEDISGES